MKFSNFDLTSLVLASGTIIGVAVISILRLMNKDKTLGINLLIVFLLCLINILFSNVAYQTNFFLNFPHFYRVFSFTSFCIGPLSYLYVRTSLDQSYQLKKYDWLFFIPALGYIIHRLPFLTLPADEKIKFINYALQTGTPVMSEPEGLLPEGYAPILRLFTGIAFIGAQFYILLKFKRKSTQAIIPLSESAKAENEERYKWLIIFSLTILSGYLLAVMSTTLQLIQNKFYGNFTALIVAFTVISISFTLFTKPRLLYGMTGWFAENTQQGKTSPTNDSTFTPTAILQDRTSTISEIQRIEILNAINLFIQSSNIHLSQGFTIRDMAKHSGIPLYQLSAFINQEFNKNFNEWLNDVRIDHFLKQLTADQKIANYTLQHIGEQLGFRSRTSFIAAVKKRTGKTPSELVGELL